MVSVRVVSGMVRLIVPFEWNRESRNGVEGLSPERRRRAAA
jgi:hypothetical protein